MENTRMEIIKAEKGDLPRLREIYAYARNYMRETGNPDQWKDSSPKEELLLEDIAAGNLYVIKEGEVTMACLHLSSARMQPTVK